MSTDRSNTELARVVDEALTMASVRPAAALSLSRLLRIHLLGDWESARRRAQPLTCRRLAVDYQQLAKSVHMHDVLIDNGGHMPHVYTKVRELAGHELVGSGDCVELVKAFAPGLKGTPTTAWRPGERVVDVTHKLAPGTAIATFENGRYPHRLSGQHAAFFVSSAGAGIWVMDQWKNDPHKPAVSLRHIERKGKSKDGKWKDPSNNAEAFSVIE